MCLSAQILLTKEWPLFKYCASFYPAHRLLGVTAWRPMWNRQMKKTGETVIAQYIKEAAIFDLFASSPCSETRCQ